MKYICEKCGIMFICGFEESRDARTENKSSMLTQISKHIAKHNEEYRQNRYNEIQIQFDATGVLCL